VRRQPVLAAHTNPEMTTRLLTTVSAVIEAATGIALIAVPELVARVLLGAGLSDSGIAVGRLAGCALLSLALACCPTADSITPSAVRALFAYNLLAALYLGYFRVSGEFVAFLLWPACALHAGLALLFARPAYGKASGAKADRASK
jgi:hypothetical protein